jgi:hypothetical protein
MYYQTNCIMFIITVFNSNGERVKGGGGGLNLPNLTQVLYWRLSHLKRDWKEEMHQYLLCFIINLFSSDKESFTQNLTNTG